MPPKVSQRIREQEEQKIFKELEELGWKVIFNNNCYLKLINKWHCTILIDKTLEAYECYCTTMQGEIKFSSFIKVKTHRLLYKLFELWGWN